MTTLEASLDALIVEPGVPELVQRYYDAGRPFAGHSFDRLGENPPDRFTEADLVAASLLDVRFEPRAVRALLDRSAGWSRLLDPARLPTDVAIWDMGRPDYDHSVGLWQRVRDLPGIGPTRAGKPLARKRPALVPIYDSVVEKFLLPGPRGLWWGLYDALQDEERRANLAALAASVSPEPSLLRTIDVAIWMRNSQSMNAKEARAAAGLPVEALPPARQR